MQNSSNQDSLNPDQQQQLLFMMLIQQHQQIAMMGMGKIKNPASDRIERDLSSAKFAIDTLNMLKKFTKGNLPGELTNYLDQTLTTLRLNYADEKKKDAGQEGNKPGENSPDQQGTSEPEAENKKDGNKDPEKEESAPKESGNQNKGKKTTGNQNKDEKSSGNKKTGKGKNGNEKHQDKKNSTG